MFTKAKKEQLKAKVCMDGGSGSGKTYSALVLGTALASGGKIALLDTENRSASLYADKFDFDVMDLTAPFTPEKYIAGIKEAEKEGYSVIIIDSITHEWSGKGGCLELVDGITQGSSSKNSYVAWGKVTPRHNDFISAILNSPCHIISTVRVKMGYETDRNSQGKTTVTKVGMQPITREGFEYENTVVFSLNQNHIANCTKDRTRLFDGKDFMITPEIGYELLNWLNSGTAPQPKQTAEKKLSSFGEKIKNLHEKLGAEHYLKILGNNGYSHSSEIPESERDGIVEQLEVAAKQIEVNNAE